MTIFPLSVAFYFIADDMRKNYKLSGIKNFATSNTRIILHNLTGAQLF